MHSKGSGGGKQTIPKQPPPFPLPKKTALVGCCTAFLESVANYENCYAQNR